MRRILVSLAVLGAAANAGAAPVTYQFTGSTTNGSMTVNDGTSAGTIPAGTPFSGSLTFDNAQTVTPVAFAGGTHAVYAFTEMTLTIGTTTVSWGPGTIDLYDNLTSSTSGYPIGDSIYANLSSRVPPNGLINGAQFNFIFLGLVDSTGTAFSGAGLPDTLNFASFQGPFLEFNFGTKGTPWGAGNTSMIQPLFTLSKTSATPAPPPTITTTSLPNGVVGVPYSAPITASAPNNDPTGLAVAGLPPGLSFDGAIIAGIPTGAGTSSVAVTATDAVTQLSTSSTLPLTINNPTISFTPALPDGVINSAYVAAFAAATGGTGSFTYEAAGLPPGLTLSGTSVSGTPSLAGVFLVTLTATDTAANVAVAQVTMSITDPVPVPCSGRNAVESAYVARNPGYIVVNGGLNLLDHLWTTYLSASNTTFLGGLVNWYQTGLILDYAGTVDPNGCVLSSLTVRPAVTIDTAALPDGVVRQAYSAPIAVSWGVAPYATTVSGLPAGLSFDGANVTGVPTAAGSFAVAVTAIDGVGASASKILSLTIAAAPGNYTSQDSGQGRITAVGPGYLMIGSKTLVWNAVTKITVNTPDGERHVIDDFVKVGMKAQWKGLRDNATNTVLTSRLEVN